MCSIGAIIHKTMNINNLLYEIIFNLQHRGQECCGFISYKNCVLAIQEKLELDGLHFL